MSTAGLGLGSRGVVGTPRASNPTEGLENTVSDVVARDLLDGHVQRAKSVAGSGGLGTGDLLGGDQKPGATVAATDAAGDPGGVQVESVDISRGAKVGPGSVCGDEEKTGTGIGRVQTEGVETGGAAGTANEPDAVAAGGFRTGGLKVERNLEGVRVEAVDIFNGTEYAEEAGQELLPIDKNLMDIGDLVTLGSDAMTTVPVVEAESGDGHLVSDGLMGTGDFVAIDVGLAKVVMGIKAQSADAHPVYENAMDKGDTSMADVGSIAVVPIVESQSRDTYLIGENNNDIGDLVTDSLCLAVETRAEATRLLDEDLIEKGDFVVEDPIPVVMINVPETSKPSEIQSFVYPLGDNPGLGAPSGGSLADGSPCAKTLEVESSPGGGRMDVESNVLKDGFPAPDEWEVELVQKSEAEQQTPALKDSMADAILVAGSVQIGEQELLESSERQTLQHGTVTPWTLYVEKNQRARYNLPPQDTTQFSVSDLVWGKVKSHPWWPGQIFDHSDASGLAMKNQRKDNFLIAYFGDGTFAWRDKSQLKPFYTNFSQMEKQSCSDVFIYAVNDVLGEVSRRMELGMTCSCFPEEAYTDIKYQKVENAGIREGTDNSFFNRSPIVNYFQPDRLLEYIKALAQIPTGGADRLELVIAKAQLKAFYHSKGYPELPEFIFGGGIMENVEISPSWDKKPTEISVEQSTPMSSESIPGKRKRGRPPKNTPMSSKSIPGKRKRGRPPKYTPISSESIPGKRKRGRPPKKQKHFLEDGGEQKSFSELMGEKNVSRLANVGKSGSGVKAAGVSDSRSSGKNADSGKTKKKRFDSLGDLDTKSPTLGSYFEVGDSRERKKKRSLSLGDLETKSPSPTLNSSFKVGEYIRRVASQLTGLPPIVKFHGETFQKSVSKDDLRVGDAVSTDAFHYTPVPKRRTRKYVSSPDEMLSQLCLAARDPLKGYSFLSMIVSFFTDFRNSCASSSSEYGEHSGKMGGKSGRENAVSSESASSDMSTPDHMKDSYWSDMTSHNSSGKGLLSNGLKRKGETDVQKQRKKRKSAGQPSPSCLLGPTTDTAQQLQFGTLTPNMKPASAVERSIISVEEKIVDTPTALILSFNSTDSLPSEADLIRIFGRYGPLMEAETEVLWKTNRVKVVFKRRADAEIAFSSAGKFSVFGPALVSYRIKYMPSAPRTSPDTSPLGENHAAPIEGGDLEVSAQAETKVAPNTAQVGAVVKG